MNPIAHLLKILATHDSRLLMMYSEYIAELASLAPYFFLKKDAHYRLLTYKEIVQKEAKNLAEKTSIPITDTFNSTELKENTLAYHRIKGMIIYDTNWNFSTKHFQTDLLTAEANDNISGHFLHITSGGGEAYYLEQVAQTMQSLKKPTYALIEKVCGSAGYYIASQCNHVASLTQYDNVGCIGTMVGFMDLEPMFKKWGINVIKEFAEGSDLKNKKYYNLIDGKPKQFIAEELNPLREQFVADVKKMRPKIAALSDDHPVLRGETFYSGKAIKNGLVDEITTFDNALADAYALATEWHNSNITQQQALKYL